MPRTLFRIIASLLVSCLAVPPNIAGALCAPCFQEKIPLVSFQSQALIQPFVQAWAGKPSVALWHEEGLAQQPFAIAPRTYWGELLEECLTGGIYLDFLLSEFRMRGALEIYPEIRIFLNPKNLDALIRLLLFKVAPEQETGTFFIKPAINLLLEIRQSPFADKLALQEYVRSSIEEMVQRAVDKHHMAYFADHKEPQHADTRHLEGLKRELLSWIQPLEEFLLQYAVPAASDESLSKDFETVSFKILAAHEQYNRNIYERAPGYVYKPYATIRGPIETPTPVKPLGIASGTPWAELLLECLSGGANMEALLKEPHIRAFLNFHPIIMKVFVNPMNLEAIIRTLVLEAGPQHETMIFFLLPSYELITLLRFVSFQNESAARGFVKQAITNMVERAIIEHRRSFFPGKKTAAMLSSGQLLELQEEFERWAKPLEEFFYGYAMLLHRDEIIALDELEKIGRGIASAHREYNRSVSHKLPGYTNKPYAIAQAS